MTEVKVTEFRVERSEGGWEPIHDLSITAKQCAIIDFVGQLCKEYEIPHNRGLNIRYSECSESSIHVSVEVISTLNSTIIEFMIEKSQANYGWRACRIRKFPSQIKTEGRWRKFTIYHHIDGKYSFLPSGRNLRLG